MVITFLSDFGLAGRLRRNLPRRDEADRARGGDHRHHARHPAAARAPGLARALQHAPVHARRHPPRGRRPRRRRPAPARSRCATGDGRVWWGPTTGCSSRPPRRSAGSTAAHELTNPEYALDRSPATFHGRDLFSPAAAHLASGVATRGARPGGRARVARAARRPAARRQPATGSARAVLYVDRFGNMQLNLTREHLERLGVAPGRHASSSSSRSSATTPSPRARSRTRGRATSSSTRTHTRTSRSRSAAAAPRRLFGAARSRTFASTSARREPARARAQLGRKFARLTTNAGRAPARALALLSRARPARSSTGSRRAGTRCAAPTLSRRSSSRSTRCRRCAEARARPRDRHRARGVPRSRGASGGRGRRRRPRRRDDRARPGATRRRSLPGACASRRPTPSGCPTRTASFDLVALANMIPFFDELARVTAPGGTSSSRSRPAPRRRSTSAGACCGRSSERAVSRTLRTLRPGRDGASCPQEDGS